MQALRWVAFAFGVLFVAVSALSLVVSLVVPRRLASRPSIVIEGFVRRIFLAFANRSQSYEIKDKILGSRLQPRCSS